MNVVFVLPPLVCLVGGGELPFVWFWNDSTGKREGRRYSMSYLFGLSSSPLPAEVQVAGSPGGLELPPLLAGHGAQGENPFKFDLFINIVSLFLDFFPPKTAIVPCSK
jgi:hypothetical protein